MPDDDPNRTLRRLDTAANRLNAGLLSAIRWLLMAAGALLAVAATAYAGLWVLDLLSWGSSLEDYQPWLEGPAISTDKPTDCLSTYDSPGSATVYLSPREC